MYIKLFEFLEVAQSLLKSVLFKKILCPSHNILTLRNKPDLEAGKTSISFCQQPTLINDKPSSEPSNLVDINNKNSQSTKNAKRL